MGLLRNRTAEATEEVIERLLEGLPVKSISLDNGSEFSNFHEIEQILDTLVYFAEPHKPWQRGTNENTNDLIRFFFPKGFDFRSVTDEDVQFVENLLNNRPRKCLDWKTPDEVFFNLVLHLLDNLPGTVTDGGRGGAIMRVPTGRHTGRPLRNKRSSVVGATPRGRPLVTASRALTVHPPSPDGATPFQKWALGRRISLPLRAARRGEGAELARRMRCSRPQAALLFLLF